MKPLCIDLYCGLGGWTEGFLAEGFDCVGFDIKRHRYGEHRYPAQLVLGDSQISRRHGSKSSARKAASARIAKIPFPLARHIAQVFHTK